jgi:hypothetical protein
MSKINEINEIKVIVPRNEVVLVDKGKPLYVDPLTKGEKLVKIGKYNDYLKPLYDNSLGDFIESATPEEIEAHKKKYQPSESVNVFELQANLDFQTMVIEEQGITIEKQQADIEYLTMLVDKGEV